MRTAAIIFLLLGSFLLGVVVMFTIAHSYGVIEYPERLDLTSFDWNGVSAIAALLTFAINVLLVLTVVIGFKGVQEGQAARSAQVLAWATAQMDAVKADEKRLRNSPLDFRDWDDAMQESAGRVCNAYQRMCYYARNGLIDARHFRSNWGVNTSIYWLLLEPYVKSEREKFSDWATAREGAYLRADFEAMALKFISHFNKANPGMIAAYRVQRAQQAAPTALTSPDAASAVDAPHSGQPEA